jgi:hypothetical protein
MKKTYINPTMEVVRVQTRQMLAASAPMYNENATGDGLAPEFDFNE